MKKLLITLPFLLFPSLLIAQEAPMTVQERSDAGLAIIPNEPPKYKPGEQLENAKVELGLGELELIATASSAESYSKAHQYKGANTDLLYKMLEDNRLSLKWPRVVSVIAIVSDDKGLERLADYAKDPAPDNFESWDRVRSRSAALASIIDQGKERNIEWIMPFAIEYTSSKAWQNSIPALKTKDARHLAIGTIAAISRQRTPEAVKALEGVLDKHQNERQLIPQSTSDEQKRFENFIKDMISSAKGENDDHDHIH